MQSQSVFHIVREEIPGTKDDAASRKAAIASNDTSAVAGAAAAGVAIKDYHRIIEPPVDGSDTKTVTAWNLQQTEVSFSPNFAEENIPTGEVIRRMKDAAWQQANPDHPIAFMAQAIEAYKRLVRAIREKRPLVSFKRGGATAYLVLGGDEQKGRKLLAKARFSQDEIEKICSEIYAKR